MMNWIWLGAVVAFGVLEAATAALVSIWFVGGAAVTLFIFAAVKIKGFCGRSLFLSALKIAASGAVGGGVAVLLRGFFEKNAVNLSVFQNFLVCAIVFSGECVVYLICISILRRIGRKENDKNKEV